MIKKFKEKFIKNKIIYKCYRILKSRPFVSNSAFGEEILVNRIFKSFKYGFFVDVGAYNPVIGSLTKKLYDKGWNGINIDFSEPNIKLLKLFRKRDISLQTGVSDKNGIQESFSFDPSSGTNTLNRNYAEGWSKNFFKNFKEKKIRCQTLTKILNDHGVKNDFEYLNIDVEGHDLSVLRGLDLNLYKPKLITCEIIPNQKKLWDGNKTIYFSTLEQVLNSDICKYLQKHKYKLISHYYLTSFFVSDQLA